LKQRYAEQNMTEEQKRALMQQKLEEKKRELAEKKKAEIENLKKQFIDAKERGDTEQIVRLMDMIKGKKYVNKTE